MRSSPPTTTLGVVVLHRPEMPVQELAAVRDLAGQVDELLIIRNGIDAAADGRDVPEAARLISFDTNRGTAAAWNAALSSAITHQHRYLYILDQDSSPGPDAVTTALVHISAKGAGAVVQPTRRERLGLVPFPWNTVASGSLYEVGALERVGGFDERLFVDEVDHEVLFRLMSAGYPVEALPHPTIDHQVGSPRQIRVLGRPAWITGHSVERHRLRGYSTGLLVRRYVLQAPAIALRLVLREGVTIAKDVVAGEAPSARALLLGLSEGLTTADPPPRAAQRSCAYCNGPLLGRYGGVRDWIFGNGRPADVYGCERCGALVADEVPSREEMASWYVNYFTHDIDPDRKRVWSRLWPTPRRRAEMERLHRYLTAAVPARRFLEVGAGSGERLVEFADAGWDVMGQDPDPKAGGLARNRGLVVHRCEVSELVGRVEPFDLIGLSHVVEHAPDPRAVLAACAALLTPTGRLCIICPNAQALGRRVFGRWWYGLDQPRHLAVPTLESLQILCVAVGLQVVGTEFSSTNAAVLLGGSLARPFEERLPAGRLRRAARFLTAFLGQTIGRAAVLIDHRLGEEVVWVGRRSQA